MASAPPDTDHVASVPSTIPIMRRGLAIAGILLIAANLRAAITVVGPLLGDVRADLDISSVAASALISLPLLCFAVFSPVAPMIAAQWGMERTLAAALGSLAVAIVIRSVPWMPALWIGTILLGVSIATMNVLLPALLKRDFPTEASCLTGIFSSISAAVAAAASGLAVPIAGLTDHGWRLAFGIWAAVALIGLGVFLPQLRRRTLPKHDHAAALENHPGGHRSPWSSALGWQITMFMGVQSLFFYTVLTWWPTIEESHGTTTATAGVHQGIMQMFSIVGSLLAAALLHKLPKDQRGAVLFLVSTSAAAVLGQLFLPAWSLLWNAFLGIGIGGSIVVALSFFALRTRNHGQAAALSGMAQSVGYLLAATGPLLFGALHDSAGSWTIPMIVLLLLLAAQLVFGSLAARNKVLA